MLKTASITLMKMPICVMPSKNTPRLPSMPAAMVIRPTRTQTTAIARFAAGPAAATSTMSRRG